MQVFRRIRQSHNFFFEIFFRYVIFLPKKDLYFSKFKKNGRPDITICLKDSKKVNIFEIGSLEVYDRGVGGVPRVYIELRPYMKIDR